MTSWLYFWWARRVFWLVARPFADLLWTGSSIVVDEGGSQALAECLGGRARLIRQCPAKQSACGVAGFGRRPTRGRLTCGHELSGCDHLEQPTGPDVPGLFHQSHLRCAALERLV